MQWNLRQGKAGTPMLIDSKTSNYKFEVHAPVFSKKFDQALQCVPHVAK